MLLSIHISLKSRAWFNEFRLFLPKQAAGRKAIISEQFLPQSDKHVAIMKLLLPSFVLLSWVFVHSFIRKDPAEEDINKIDSVVVSLSVPDFCNYEVHICFVSIDRRHQTHRWQLSYIFLRLNIFRYGPVF